MEPPPSHRSVQMTGLKPLHCTRSQLSAQTLTTTKTTTTTISNPLQRSVPTTAPHAAAQARSPRTSTKLPAQTTPLPSLLSLYSPTSVIGPDLGQGNFPLSPDSRLKAPQGPRHTTHDKKEPSTSNHDEDLRRKRHLSDTDLVSIAQLNVPNYNPQPCLVT